MLSGLVPRVRLSFLFVCFAPTVKALTAAGAAELSKLTNLTALGVKLGSVGALQSEVSISHDVALLAFPCPISTAPPRRTFTHVLIHPCDRSLPQTVAALVTGLTKLQSLELQAYRIMNRAVARIAEGIHTLLLARSLPFATPDSNAVARLAV